MSPNSAQSILNHPNHSLPPISKTVKLSGTDPEAKRQELKTYFQSTFDLYDSLFDCLATEDAWYKKSIPLRHPLIFYYGHTAAFFVNKLLIGRFIHERVDPIIESTVAIGVDEMSWDDLDERHYQWPTIARLREYRQQVRQLVSEFIEEMPLTLPIDWESPAWAILMGIEHERIHLETSSVLIRQLPLERVTPQPRWIICPEQRNNLEDVPQNTLIPVPAQAIQQGKPLTDDTYGWDNEYGVRTINLESFQASQYLVSNAEYLAFIQDGGYENEKWWTKEGQGWLKFSQAHQPTFWIGSIDDLSRMKLRVMCEEIPMSWDWPVETNQLEAAAFCRWKSEKTALPIQLPSESEWYGIRNLLPIDQPDWNVAPGNLNLEYWSSSSPVDRFKQGDFYDVIGNVWQWTSTAIDGFDGFRIHPLYDDFSTPTFDGKHSLIKGGSWISTGNLALQYSRYAFRRHFFQHAGFRYVVSRYQEPDVINPYETDPLVAQYLDSHYGQSHFGVKNHCQVLAEIADHYATNKTRALDIGCSVGRASYELSKYFQHVDGVDFSARFIDIAETLAKQNHFRYAITSEGDLIDYREARLSDCGLEPTLAEKIHFSQGDACNLKDKYRHYDLILAANILDRLREPERFLRDIRQRLRPNGVLLLCSPHTWQESSTNKDNWLGGIRENGEALSTYQAIQRILATEFTEIAAPIDVPFVLQETNRKYQMLVSQLSIWQKQKE